MVQVEAFPILHPLVDGQPSWLYSQFLSTIVTGIFDNCSVDETTNNVGTICDKLSITKWDLFELFLAIRTEIYQFFAELFTNFNHILFMPCYWPELSPHMF